MSACRFQDLLPQIAAAVLVVLLLVGALAPAASGAVRRGPSIDCGCKVKMACCLAGHCTRAHHRHPGPSWSSCPREAGVAVVTGLRFPGVLPPMAGIPLPSVWGWTMPPHSLCPAEALLLPPVPPPEGLSRGPSAVIFM